MPPKKQVTITIQGNQDKTTAELLSHLEEIRQKILDGTETETCDDGRQYGYSFKVTEGDEAHTSGEGQKPLVQQNFFLALTKELIFGIVFIAVFCAALTYILHSE